MEIRKGMAVSGGIAAGRLFYYRRKRQTADRSEPADVSLELLRFQNAREYAIKELQDLYERAERKPERTARRFSRPIKCCLRMRNTGILSLDGLKANG